jgi:Carboxypeptidase regulatory-like domain
MRFDHFKSNIFAFLICVFVCGPLGAQVVSVAQINGTVKDQSDALLPGVEIKVTQTETGYTRTVSNETGTYTLPNLPVGPRGTVPAGGFVAWFQELRANGKCAAGEQQSNNSGRPCIGCRH